eukprot:TRINITY_DN5251_c0_g1_i1.p1 TRINITY_DN5251_c0_g1~~TRINITY_DN5251_c0_g1_i1.p1  ORF type:complete len:796 (+),score=102.35 TRINITY_DN5251_c0_g1_i1:46-2388(+)
MLPARGNSALRASSHGARTETFAMGMPQLRYPVAAVSYGAVPQRVVSAGYYGYPGVPQAEPAVRAVPVHTPRAYAAPPSPHMHCRQMGAVSSVTPLAVSQPLKPVAPVSSAAVAPSAETSGVSVVPTQPEVSPADTTASGASVVYAKPEVSSGEHVDTPAPKRHQKSDDDSLSADPGSASGFDTPAFGTPASEHDNPSGGRRNDSIPTAKVIRGSTPAKKVNGSRNASPMEVIHVGRSGRRNGNSVIATSVVSANPPIASQVPSNRPRRSLGSRSRTTPSPSPVPAKTVDVRNERRDLSRDRVGTNGQPRRASSADSGARSRALGINRIGKAQLKPVAPLSARTNLPTIASSPSVSVESPLAAERVSQDLHLDEPPCDHTPCVSPVPHHCEQYSLSKWPTASPSSQAQVSFEEADQFVTNSGIESKPREENVVLKRELPFDQTSSRSSLGQMDSLLSYTASPCSAVSPRMTRLRASSAEETPTMRYAGSLSRLSIVSPFGDENSAPANGIIQDGMVKRLTNQFNSSSQDRLIRTSRTSLNGDHVSDSSGSRLRERRASTSSGSRGYDDCLHRLNMRIQKQHDDHTNFIRKMRELQIQASTIAETSMDADDSTSLGITPQSSERILQESASGAAGLVDADSHVVEAVLKMQHGVQSGIENTQRETRHLFGYCQQLKEEVTNLKREMASGGQEITNLKTEVAKLQKSDQSGRQAREELEKQLKADQARLYSLIDLAVRQRECPATAPATPLVQYRDEVRGSPDLMNMSRGSLPEATPEVSGR